MKQCAKQEWASLESRGIVSNETSRTGKGQRIIEQQHTTKDTDAVHQPIRHTVSIDRGLESLDLGLTHLLSMCQSNKDQRPPVNYLDTTREYAADMRWSPEVGVQGPAGEREIA